jgi:UDP-N-acetylmuramoyl-tripeptide--D-alanyl-D-alanine ligase
MAARTAAPVLRFGISPTADIRAVDVESDQLGRPRFGLSWQGETVSVGLGLSGEHQVGNALAAAAVALRCGMSLADVAAALQAATPRSRWRMELTERADGILIVNDAYNANPESMRAALKTLAGLAGPAHQRRTWAVLGEMAELGPTAVLEHDAIGRLAVRLDISRLVAVGERARPIAQGGALEGSWNGESTWVPDTDAAVELLRRELAPGDVVLVKASRSAGLERVALALAADTRDGTAA